MKIKLKTKKILFLIASFSLLSPLVVACSRPNSEDNFNLQKLEEVIDNLKTNFENISSKDHPLETVLKNRSIKPNAQALTSLEALDNLVAENPYSAFGPLPSSVKMSSIVSEIKNDGTVEIEVTFLAANFKPLKVFTTIKGFITQEAADLANFTIRLNNISPKNRPLRVASEHSFIKPQEDLLTTIKAFDNLVDSTAFSKALGNNLPLNIKMNSIVSEISQDGLVTITIEIFLRNIKKTQAQVFLSGFKVFSQSDLNRLARELNAASTENNPLLVVSSKQQETPLASSITLIQDLDNLVNGSPFSQKLSNFSNLDKLISIQAEVSQISLNRQAKITLTLSKEGLIAQKATIVLKGFELDNSLLKKELDHLSELLSLQTTLEKPILTSLKDKSNPPSSQSLKEISDLDNLVEGTPFSQKLSSLPDWVILDIKASEINLEGIVTISLTLKDKLDSRTATSENKIYLGGFASYQDTLNQLRDTLVALSPEDKPLLTILEDRKHLPQANWLNSLASLDNLVINNPFSTALENLFQNINLEAKVFPINDLGVVKITLTLSRSFLNEDSSLTTFKTEGNIFIANFENKIERDFANLARQLSLVSPQNNPLEVLASQKHLKSQEQNLTTITSLDSLVMNNPFSSQIGLLPQEVTMKTVVSELMPNDIVHLRVTLSRSISNLENQNHLQEHEVDIFLKGFSFQEQSTLDAFVRVFSLISPENRPIRILESQENHKPQAFEIENNLEILDTYVPGTPFKDFLSSTPRGLKIETHVNEIQLNRELVIDFDFSLEGLQMRHAKVFLVGFEPSRDHLRSMINSLVTSIVQQSSQNSPLETILVNKFDAPVVNSLEDLDNLVFGKPFSQGITLLPDEVGFKTKVFDLDATGTLRIALTLFDKKSATLGNPLEVTKDLFIKGFSPPQSTLNLWASKMQNLSSQTSPLNIYEALVNKALRAEELKSLNDLDALVNESPFSEELKFLPLGVSISAEVGVISLEGELRIKITFSKMNFEDTNAFIYLQGFRKFSQNDLDNFKNILARVSPQNSPLSVNDTNKTLKPQADLLHSIKSLDNLVAGNPFVNSLGELPQGLSMQALVHDIQFNRQVRIEITLSAPNLQSVQTEVVLKDFVLDNETIIKMLNQLAQTFRRISPEYKPLQTANPNRDSLPNPIDLTSLKALDNLVEGIPFSQAANGSLPEGLRIEILRIILSDDGKLLLGARFVDIASHSDSSETNPFINAGEWNAFIVGYDHK